MTDTRTGRAGFYRGGDAPISPPALGSHTFYMRDEQIAQNAKGAAKTKLSLSSHLRLAVERYLAQPYRVPVPGNITPKHARRSTFRCEPKLWRAITFRAQQEERTASAVIAAALILDANGGVPPVAPGRLSAL